MLFRLLHVLVLLLGHLLAQRVSAHGYLTGSGPLVWEHYGVVMANHHGK